MTTEKPPTSHIQLEVLLPTVTDLGDKAGRNIATECGLTSVRELLRAAKNISESVGHVYVCGFDL